MKNIVIILTETSHPGNIGSAARAIKTMGLSTFRLVKPQSFPDPEATALSANASDVLEKAEVYDDFLSAIADCGIVYGTAAGTRDQVWPVIDVRDMVKTIDKKYRDEKVAIVFGRESTGLRNEELRHCHAQIQIPTGSAYSSLNLAQAVQIVCYELFQGLQYIPSAKTDYKLADHSKQEALYNAFSRASQAVHYFDPERPLNFPVRIRQIIQSMGLLDKDADLLLGFLKRVK